MADEYAAAMIQIAGKTMPEDAAHQTATVIILMRDTNPKAKITLWVADYDDDPREVWEIPEVRNQIIETICLVFAMRPHWYAPDLNLDDESVALVRMCSDRLKMAGIVTEAGNRQQAPS